MRNFLRPHTKQEIEVPTPVELTTVERAGLQLLQTAQRHKREEVERLVKAYARDIKQEADCQSLDHLLSVRTKELKWLVRTAYKKENDYYYTRRGKRAAHRLIAEQHKELNPRVSEKEALRFAKHRLERSKKMEGRKLNGRILGRIAIAPHMEMPQVCKIEGEFIGEDIYAEQYYQLEFGRQILAINHIIIDRHNPDIVTKNEEYTLAMPYIDSLDAELISSSGEAITEHDHYFVLGLIEETITHFQAAKQS